MSRSLFYLSGCHNERQRRYRQKAKQERERRAGIWRLFDALSEVPQHVRR